MDGELQPSEHEEILEHMGRNSRQRHAAKRRAGTQQASAPREPRPNARGDEPGGPTGSDSVDRITLALEMAIARTRRGDRSARVELARKLTSAATPSTSGQVSRAVTAVLTAHLAQLWAHGWLPEDVHQVTRRNASALALSLAVDTIAEVQARAPVATTHPRWLDQVQAIGARSWWEPGRPHLDQWVERHEVDPVTAVATAVELAAALSALPRLPQILPPPGAARADTPRTSRVDPRVLGRVRGLLAKAESTSFAAEAEALSAKAQELMSRHAIERAVLDAETHAAPSVTGRRLWLDNPYLAAKSLLVSEVAAANRSRAVSYERLGFVTVLGDDVDVEIVELLTASLLVQATRAMLGVATRPTGRGPSRTRSFRHAFLLSYATRIGERLGETAADSVASAGTALVPVFADRARAIDERFDELFTHTVSRSFSVGNAEGWGAGRAAADRAELGTGRRAVGQRDVTRPA